MPKYKWYQKIWKSLVPGDFYLHILKESIGKAFGYILLFILALSILVGGYLGYKTKVGMDELLVDYSNGTIPAITLTDGTLNIVGDDPVLLPYFETFVVIDHNFGYDVNDLMTHDSYLLFHPTSISITQKGVGPLVYNYTDILPFDVSSDDVATFIKLTGILLIPMSILSQFMVSTTTFFFNSIFLLLLGNILRSAAGIKMKMGRIYHLVIYAMTFSVFWTHFTTLLPAQVPIWLDNFVFFAYPAIILINLFSLIKKNPSDYQDKN